MADRISKGKVSAPLLAEAALQRASGTPIFIDVSEKATTAEVSRGGFSLGEIPIRPEILTGILENRPILATKVVSQSIAPGTAVAQGTAVDIVLTHTDDLPMIVVPGIHEAFNAKTVGAVFNQFQANATVKDIIRRRTDPSQLTADEQTLLTATLEANQVHIGTAPTNNLDSAFTALQAAFTFQG
jgi:hypothetical protein